ncbi:unnamed protein product [Discula destructiva]
MAEAAGQSAGEGDTGEPTPTITLLRHGHAWNNMIAGFPCRDPILTERGFRQASEVLLSHTPDLIVVSPLTRTLQTAITAFDLDRRVPTIPVQVWPDLRECGDRPFNMCRPRDQLAERYPHFDFNECKEHGVYDQSHSGRTRAKRVRRRLMALSREGGYRHIVVVSHSGFIRRLNGGLRGYKNCECWTYRVGVDFSITEDGDLAPPQAGSTGPTQVAAGEQPEVDEAVEDAGA